MRDEGEGGGLTPCLSINGLSDINSRLLPICYEKVMSYQLQKVVIFSLFLIYSPNNSSFYTSFRGIMIVFNFSFI